MLRAEYAKPATLIFATTSWRCSNRSSGGCSGSRPRSSTTPTTSAPTPTAPRSAATRPRRRSVVSILTALYFALPATPATASRSSRTPRPAYHAIQYLLGNLDRKYLTTLREFGGLQAYPSRTKDPDPVDFSTGSVGLGAVAPLFAALADRYAASHFGGGQPPRRFVALVGDAELDEGNVWEAVTEEALAGPRQRALDRRPQPPEPRPRHPRHPRQRS